MKKFLFFILFIFIFSNSTSNKEINFPSKNKIDKALKKRDVLHNDVNYGYWFLSKSQGWFNWLAEKSLDVDKVALVLYISPIFLKSPFDQKAEEENINILSLILKNEELIDLVEEKLNRLRQSEEI